MIIRLADIIKKPAIMLIHIDEVLKDKPPAKNYFFAGGFAVKQGVVGTGGKRSLVCQDRKSRKIIMKLKKKTLIYHRKYKRKRPDIWIIYKWLMVIR